MYKKAFPHNLSHLKNGALIHYDPADTILDIENADAFIELTYRLDDGRSLFRNDQWHLQVEHISFRRFCDQYEIDSYMCIASHFPKLKSVVWVKEEIDENGMLSDILLDEELFTEYKSEVKESKWHWQSYGGDEEDLSIQFMHCEHNKRLLITEAMLETDIESGSMISG